MKNLKRAVGGALATAVLLGAGAVGGGCYGPFRLTTKLWNWNGSVTESRWANEGIFLVCVILPVYGICTWVDALVLNSIEFWTGKNPMGGDEKKAEAPRIERRDGMTVAADECGNALFTARTTADGGIVVADACGQTVGNYTAAEVDRTLRALGR